MHCVATFRACRARQHRGAATSIKTPSSIIGCTTRPLFVAEKLASFGINLIETGIAETGIVALIQGEGGEGTTIGLRADRDGSPMLEASTSLGRRKYLARCMHAVMMVTRPCCGRS